VRAPPAFSGVRAIRFNNGKGADELLQAQSFLLAISHEMTREGFVNERGQPYAAKAL
jgi:hypothetical protein